MKNETISDSEGTERNYSTMTIEESYRYDKTMTDMGLVMLFFRNKIGLSLMKYIRPGRQIEEGRIVKIGEKQYRFIDQDGVHRNESLPKYGDA